MNKGGLPEKLMAGMLAASVVAIVHGLSLYLGLAELPDARSVAMLWMTSGSVVAILVGLVGLLYFFTGHRFRIRRVVEGQVVTRYRITSDGMIHFDIPDSTKPGKRFVRIVAPNGQMHDYECPAALFPELEEGVTGSGETDGDLLYSFRVDHTVKGSPTTRH